MKKNSYKIILTAILILNLLVINIIPVNAEASYNKIIANMDFVKIETEYNENEYYIEYKFTENQNHAYIYSRETNELTEEYVEIVMRQNTTSRSVGEITINIYDYFYPSSEVNSYLKMRAIANVLVHREYIGSQKIDTIMKVNSVSSQLVGTGPFTLETHDESINHYTGSYCSVNCIGVLTTTSSKALSAGMSIEIIKGFGFNVTSQSTSVWNARLPYSKVVKVTS